MTTFDEKSNQSFQAAETLLKIHLYPSTINRSYYCFFQYMMYILFHKMKYDREEFFRLLNQTQKKTHTLTWNLLGTEFVKKRPNSYSAREWNKEYQWLQEKVKEFKRIRECADYLEETIEKEDAEKWINNTSSMINLLKKAF